jgi:hypothetical protein
MKHKSKYTIAKLQKLAKKNLVQFQESDKEEFFTLERIDYDENCLVVYCKEHPYWVYFDECEFFVLEKVKVKLN